MSKFQIFEMRDGETAMIAEMPKSGGIPMVDDRVLFKIDGGEVLFRVIDRVWEYAKNEADSTTAKVAVMVIRVGVKEYAPEDTEESAVPE